LANRLFLVAVLRDRYRISCPIAKQIGIPEHLDGHLEIGHLSMLLGAGSFKSDPIRSIDFQIDFSLQIARQPSTLYRATWGA
jgi:hypothetical protein